MDETAQTFVRNQLSLHRSDLREIATASGVPWSTVKKVLYYPNTDHRVSTIDRLYRYFQKRNSQ